MQNICGTLCITLFPFGRATNVECRSSVSFPWSSSLFCFIQLCFQINQTNLVSLICTNFGAPWCSLSLIWYGLLIVLWLPSLSSFFRLGWGFRLRATTCIMVYLSGFETRAAWHGSLERMKYMSCYQPWSTVRSVSIDCCEACGHPALLSLNRCNMDRSL